VNEVVALVLIVLLAGSGYAAGRLHGQLGYRMGYRFGYRQGYFDGDRSSWNRRRRELQAAVASVLTTPVERRADAYPAERPTGTTYTSTAIDEPSGEFTRLPVPMASDDWSLVDAVPAPLPRRT
jgi:hypothetical protein